MPVVRVDDDVWKWLQGLARPFEDTPNSVLRRVAGLDATPLSRENGDRSSTTKVKKEEPMLTRSVNTDHTTVAKRVTGEQLNRKYRLGARHALYHKDGTFYERLTHFPGILCDARGFVRYDSKKQFDNDARLSIGEKVNIPQSLASHPRYERFANAS